MTPPRAGYPSGMTSSVGPNPETVRKAQEAARHDHDDAELDPQAAHGGSMAPDLVDDTGHELDDPGDVGGDMADARP